MPKLRRPKPLFFFDQPKKEVICFYVCSMHGSGKDMRWEGEREERGTGGGGRGTGEGEREEREREGRNGSDCTVWLYRLVLHQRGPAL